MRAAALVVLLLAGCTASPGAPPLPATAAPSLPSASLPVGTRPATPKADPSERPTEAIASPTPGPRTEHTAEDDTIATLIRAGVSEAIPQIEKLNKMEPSSLVDLFVPLGAWIAKRKADLASHKPSSCTAEAVGLYLDGIGQYDSMRKHFLAWKDWGAHGRPYPPGAPMVAVKTLRAALAELEARCPG